MADDNTELANFYPFARKQNDRLRYKIKLGSGHQGEALSIDQLQRLMDIKLHKDDIEHKEARLFFLFSFYCQGMNMRDIFLLKHSDIQGQLIRYVRQKTRPTETKESIMEIPVTDAIKNIIAEIGKPNKRPENYVFAFMPNGLALDYQKRKPEPPIPEERLTQIIQQKIKMINKRLKQLVEDYNADEKARSLKKAYRLLPRIGLGTPTQISFGSQGKAQK